MHIKMFVVHWDQEKSEFVRSCLGTIDVDRDCIVFYTVAVDGYNAVDLLHMATPKIPWHWVSTRLWAKRFCRNFEHANLHAVIC